MGEVVALAFEPEDRIWICGNCSSKNFELHEDGTTQCSLCGQRGEPGHWHENVTESDEPKVGDATRQVVDHGTADFAKAALMRSAKDPDCLVVVVLKRDGVIKTWGDVEHNETPERRAWVHKMMITAATLLLGEPAPTEGNE